MVRQSLKLFLITSLTFAVISCGSGSNNKSQDPRFINSSYYLKISNPTVVYDPKSNTGVITSAGTNEINDNIIGYDVTISDFLLHCFECRFTDHSSGKVILQTSKVDFIFRVLFVCNTVAPKDIDPEKYRCVYRAELQLVPDGRPDIEFLFEEQIPDTLQIKGLRLEQKPFFIKEVNGGKGLLYYTDYENWEDILNWHYDDELEGTVIELNDENLFQSNHIGFEDNGYLVFKEVLNKSYILQLERDTTLNRDISFYFAKLQAE